MTLRRKLGGRFFGLQCDWWD